MIQVQIAKSPGPVMALMLEDGTTLGQAIAIAEDSRRDGVKFSGEKFSFTRLAVPVDAGTVLFNNDLIMCYENLKGAMGLIKVGRVPGGSIEFAAPEGITYRQAIAMAVEEGTKRSPVIYIDGNLNKTDIRSGGNIMQPDAVIPVANNTTIALYENLKGAR